MNTPSDDNMRGTMSTVEESAPSAVADAGKKLGYLRSRDRNTVEACGGEEKVHAEDRHGYRDCQHHGSFLPGEPSK